MDYVIEEVTEDRYQDILEFIRKHYFPRERLSVTSGMPYRAAEYIDPAILSRLHQNLSLIAIERSTNRIIGVSINCITEESNRKKKDIDGLPLPIQAIRTTLSRFEENYNIFAEVGAEKGLELVSLGVHEDFGGHGIAQELTKRTIQIARESNLPFICSNPSSPVTFHIFNKLGFTLIDRVQLIDCYFNDNPGFPYAHADDAAGLVIMKL